MKLGAFFHPTGHHIASWMHPDAQIDAGTNFRHYVELAQMSERAKFDFIFLADALAVRDGNLEALSRWPQYMAYFEPITLLAGIAGQTERIGLVATATTSYNEPYNVARKFASLDHISAGRAGWNVVTSANLSEAFNFGREAHYEHGERYNRALEFTEVVCGLWDSWDDDAFLRDRATGRYFDPAKLHTLNHKGEHFSVRGPLNVARPPQGHPVIFQAGSSEVGRELAARTAEAVFTPQHSLDGAQAFYRDLKGRMAKYGRSAEHLKVMPGLNPIVGRTEQEAKDKQRYLESLIHPDRRAGAAIERAGGLRSAAVRPGWSIARSGVRRHAKGQHHFVPQRTALGAGGEAHHPPALSALRWCPRTADRGGHGHADRRSDGGMVRQSRRGRVPDPAIAFAGRAARISSLR